MQATHRVKDSKNNTVGFIIDKVFYTDYSVRNSIDYVDNLSLLSNGTIRAKKELPIIEYKKVVNQIEYRKLIRDNPFERDVQKQFKDWKKNWPNKILQVDGARQIGKTTEIKKFAYRNFENVIYINLIQSESFLSVIKEGCTPLAFEKFCVENGYIHFNNSKDTVLIIDEIQRYTKVFNSLRQIHESVNCRIIITGSYLGRYLNKNTMGEVDPFYSAGNVHKITMFPLSYKEFARVFKMEKDLKTISLYGKSQDSKYNQLMELYEIYRQIGGYPDVVMKYLETKSIMDCHSQIKDLLDIFKDESRAYFKNPREVEIFDIVYRSALEYMEKRKGITGKDMIETITTLTNDRIKGAATLVTQKEVANAIMWLKYCGIIGTCDLAVEGKIRDTQSARKIFFMDCGVVSFLAKESNITESSLRGIITETFVYDELHRLFKVDYKDKMVKGEEVCFSTLGDYELDFMIVDRDGIVYGIEAKTDSGSIISLKVYKERGLIKRGIVVKNTKGGITDKFWTIPIYTVGCRFPYEDN